MKLAFLVSVGLVALGAPTFHAATVKVEEAAPHSDIIGGGAAGSPAVAIRHSYVIDTRGLAETVAQQARLDVVLEPGVQVRLVLEEKDMFASGQKKVQYLDSEGRLIREEPILARTFLGWVEGTGEPAEMTIAPEGLYGALFFQGIEYSFQPLAWNGGIVTQEVVHDVSAPGLFHGAFAPRTDDPLQASADVSATSTLRNMNIYPVAEKSFRLWAPDWSNRILNAYFYAEAMWEDETGIRQALWAPAAPDADFASQTAAGSCAGKDLGLRAFQQNWIWVNGNSQTNVYGLWHGLDGEPDLFGCADANCSGYPSGCLQQYGALPQTRAAHVVQAKDLFSTDNYDATRSDHLGKAAAHELTHNAGEPDHPSDGYCWQPGLRNIMKPSAPMGCKGTWRVQTSRDRIVSYATPFLTG